VILKLRLVFCSSPFKRTFSETGQRRVLLEQTERRGNKEEVKEENVDYPNEVLLLFLETCNSSHSFTKRSARSGKGSNSVLLEACKLRLQANISCSVK